MSIEKIKSFNRKMARPKFAKGGYIKRKKFDDGGIATNPNASGVGGPGSLTNSSTSGIGGIAQGLGLNASSANIQPGTNTSQLNSSYTGANNALNAQVGLANTLLPQAQTGANAQNQVLQNQLDIARGAGPNPAAAQLSQATGQNVANEAALLAGQRGSSANVGLAGRSAAMAGAQAQQGAAGQAATLEAQQQIAAQQNAEQIAANQITQSQGAVTNLNTAQQNEQNILQNANSSANNNAVGMQSNINNVNAENNRGLLGGITSGIGAIGGFLGLAEGGEVHPIHKHKLDFVHKMTKTALDHFAEGGPIQGNPIVSVNAPTGSAQMPTANYAQPGAMAGAPQIEATPQSSLDLGKSAAAGYNATHKAGPNDGLEQAQTNFNDNLSDGFAQDLGATSLGDMPMAAHGGAIWDLHPSKHHEVMAHHFTQYFAGGGKIPALLSPGEVYLNPQKVEQVKQGANPLEIGDRVPGKAKVKGDSLKNDFVKADLDEGGVVVDRENVGDPKKARKFVLKSVGPKKHMKKPGKR